MSEIIVSLALSVALGVLLYIAYKQWDARHRGVNFYLSNVVAYRVGLIQKKAKENNVEMIFQPDHDTFVDEIESDVEKDLRDMNTNVI